jgi:hypothetical protein
MAAETLGEAYQLGWRVKVACTWGTPNPKSRHDRTRIECDTITDLDLKTLVWTRGAALPIAMLEGRLRCPRCGSRRVKVLFDIPNQPKRATVK